MAESLYFLQDLALILLSAAICGQLCHRLNLSPVVGYLVAGLILGTPQITFPYVSDEARISVIGQLGVVFLMFGIGLQFQLKRLRELGGGVVLATILTALLVMTFARVGADLAGMSEGAGLCLAAVFMVSSSAVIGKVLQERGLGHFRFGRVAMGMTLLEDIVAVVLLAVLGSYLASEPGMSEVSLPMTLARLAGFTVLVLVVGFLAVPRLLTLLERSRQWEVASILVAALLLTLAVLAVRAGYSSALGAFLFGLVVAETRQRQRIERSFQGLKDVFLTVFFVTIGMLIEVEAVPSALPWILGGALAALVVRLSAATLALSIAGERPREAFQAGLCLTPIGEFSFIIAGLAVASGVLPETFQVVAVGIALVTTLVSPLLMARAEQLSSIFDSPRMAGFNRMHGDYQAFLKQVAGRADTHLLWKLLRKRIFQIGREVLLVSALLLFAEPVRGAIQQATQFPAWASTAVVAVAVGGGCLVLLLAVWRNLSACALLIADYLVQDEGLGKRTAGALGALLHLGFGLLFGLWLWNLLPTGLVRSWGFLLVLLAIAGALAMAWRPMVRWQSQFELALANDTDKEDGALPNMGRAAGWDLNAEEFILPDDTRLAGMPLAEAGLRERYGVSVVGIERSGHSLQVLGPQTHLFPGDRLLLLGSPAKIKEAERFLSGPAESATGGPDLRDLVLESHTVSARSVLCGRLLSELNLPRRFGLQVVGLRRGETEQVPPDGKTLLAEGDVLLVLGTPGQLAQWAKEASS